MKYLAILLLSFSFFSPVLAANTAKTAKTAVPKTVQGTMPQLQPLQPAPAGVSAALNKNIQYQSPGYVPPVGGPGSAANPKNPAAQGSQIPGNSSAGTAPHSAGGRGNLIWWLTALLVLLVLGLWVYKRNKAE